MAAHVGPNSEPDEEIVLGVTSALLEERIQETSDVTAWVTSTEIAEATGLERDKVVETLEELSADKLHVVPVPGSHDVEVVGVRHDLDESPTEPTA